jgi:hypothetical protein
MAFFFGKRAEGCSLDAFPVIVSLLSTDKRPALKVYAAVEARTACLSCFILGMANSVVGTVWPGPH